MSKYLVKHTSILHNGKLYKEGSTIELDSHKAKRLEDFVELLPTQTQKTQTPKQQTKKETESKKETKDGGENGTKTL